MGSGEHLCRHLRLRQGVDVLARRVLGQAIHVGRPVVCAGPGAAAHRPAHLRGLCLSHLWVHDIAAHYHHLHRPRHQGLALVAGLWPGEPSTRRVHQVCHRPGAGQAVQHLRLLAEGLAQHRHRRRHHRASHPVHHPGAGDGFGAGLHVARLCALPRGAERLRAVRRAVRGGLFCGGAQVCRHGGDGNPAGTVHRLHHGDGGDCGHAVALLPLARAGRARAAGLCGLGTVGVGTVGIGRAHQRLRLFLHRDRVVAGLSALWHASRRLAQGGRHHRLGSSFAGVYVPGEFCFQQHPGASPADAHQGDAGHRGRPARCRLQREPEQDSHRLGRGAGQRLS